MVSPETSRDVLTKFISRARRRLPIYDARLRIRTSSTRAAPEGGRRRPGAGARQGAETGPGRRPPHSRTCAFTSAPSFATAQHAFVGSQSLRKLELDRRREVGVITTDPRVAKKIVSVFEADWVYAKGDKDPDNKKNDKKSDKEKKEATSAAAGA